MREHASASRPEPSRTSMPRAYAAYAPQPRMKHLVAYFANRYLHHFARDLEEIRGHGFDGVVHCVTEADREWGMGRVAEMFALTREAGLECWADPWGVAGVFGGEAHSA